MQARNRMTHMAVVGDQTHARGDAVDQPLTQLGRDGHQGIAHVAQVMRAGNALEVGDHGLGRILNMGGTLKPAASAGDRPRAKRRVAARLFALLHDSHMGTVVMRCNSGRQPTTTGANDEHVDFHIPLRSICIH